MYTLCIEECEKLKMVHTIESDETLKSVFIVMLMGIILMHMD